MRVLLQTGRFYPRLGGPATRAYYLAKTLGDLGHDVTLLTTEADDPEYRDRWPEFQVVRYRRMPVHRHPSYWRTLWLPTRQYRHEKWAIRRVPEGPWDLVWTSVRDFTIRFTRRWPGPFLIFAPGTSVCTLKREEYAGSDRVFSLWGLRQRFNYRQAAGYERRAARAADRLVVQTELLARVYREVHGIPPAKIRIIPNGVDLERFKPADDRAALRRTLGLEPEAVLVVFVGRLTVEKNVGFLLRAMAGIRSERVQAVVVGGGPEEPPLRRLAAELGLAGRVTFAGPRRNVEEYLAAGDLFVLPSTSEAFGIALVEAMAAGLPVMALRPEYGRIFTGVSENFEHGVSGFLVDPDDPADLARRIRELAEAPERARAMGRAARETAVRRFSWRQIANDLAALPREGKRD